METLDTHYVLTRRTNLNELSADLINTMRTGISLHFNYTFREAFPHLPKHLLNAENIATLDQAVYEMFDEAAKGWNKKIYNRCEPRLYHLFATAFGAVSNFYFKKSDNNDFMIVMWAEQEYPPFDTKWVHEPIFNHLNGEKINVIKWDPIAKPESVKNKL